MRRKNQTAPGSRFICWGVEGRGSKLNTPAAATKITYPAPNWNQTDLIFGTNGITALTFCDVPLEPASPNR